MDGDKSHSLAVDAVRTVANTVCKQLQNRASDHGAVPLVVRGHRDGWRGVRAI